MSFFITLIESSDASRRSIETSPRVQAMIHKGLALAEYRAFLHDLYHIVLHFCPIMAAAQARCNSFSGPDSAVVASPSAASNAPA